MDLKKYSKMIREIHIITNREITRAQTGTVSRIKNTPLCSQIDQKTCLIATQIQIYSLLPPSNKIWTTLRFSNNSDSIFNLLIRYKMMFQKSIFTLTWMNRIQINLQLLNNHRCKEIIMQRSRTILYRHKIDYPSNQWKIKSSV